MASRFWVGGTGTWDAADTTHWSATSGGAGGASVPGSSDTVTFDASSGASAVVTMTDGTNPTVQSVTRTGTVALTLAPGNNTITCNVSGTAWSFGTVTNLTVSANTATVVCSGASPTFVSGVQDWNGMSVSFTGSGTPILSSNATYANITRTGTAVKTDGFSINGTSTATGTFTVTGNSATNRVLVNSSVLGTARTITAATTSLTNVDFRDITAAGAAAWDGTSVGNALGNTGITFTTPVTRYAVATGSVSSTSVWSATSGGASGASVPLCHDTMVLDAASGAVTVTNDMPRMCADLTCTGFTGTLAFGSTATEVYGSITYGSGMTVSGTASLTLRGRSSHTLTSAGKTWTQLMTFDCTSAGTYTLADAFTNDRTTRTAWVSGTFNDGGFNVTFSSVGSGVNYDGGTLVASGTWTLASTTAVAIWEMETAPTVTFTGSVILSGSTANDRTFAGGGKTYGTLTDQNTLGGKLTVTGANTFGTINKTATVACTLELPTSSGITVTGDLNINGVSGAVLTLTGDIAKATGRVIARYLSIANSDATGGAGFYAPGGIDGGGNTGWAFTEAPSGGTVAGTAVILFDLV